MRAFAMLIALSACDPLAPLPGGTCGNGVIDPGEDCDPAVVLPGVTCSENCHFSCAANAACPGVDSDTSHTVWACGSDHSCRHATGAYRATGTLFPVAAIDMAFADLDGDGQLDVFGYEGRDAFAHMGQPGGGFAGGTAVDDRVAVYGAPAFGDLDGDGRIDVVAGAAHSLEIGFGGDRSGFVIAPQARSSLPAAIESVAIRTDAANAPFQDVLVITATSTASSNRLRGRIIDVASGVEAPEIDLGLFHVSVTFPGFISNGAGPISVVDLDGDRVDEVVALNSDGVVRIYNVDRAAGSPALALRTSVVIGVNFSGARVFAADVTHDGTIDLVIATSFGVFVAPGDGLGGLGPALRDPTLEVTATLLAIVDLDGDGEVDLVGENGVWLRGGGSPTQVFQTIEPWLEAASGDFNHDGRLDLAGRPSLGSALGSGIEILLAAPNGLFDESVVFTADAIIGIRAGDFDGDLFTDLAITAVVGGDTGSNLVELKIAYGGPSGLATELSTGITSSGALLVEPANLRLDTSLLTVDAAQDLIINRLEVVAPATTATSDLLFVMGNAPRLPDAELPLPASFALPNQRALTVIGKLDPAGGDAADILVESNLGAWALISGHPGKRRFLASDLQTVTAIGVVDWCTQAQIVKIRGALVGDLDGDGRDEIVGIGCTGSPRIQIAHLAATASGLALTVTESDLGSMTASFTGLREARLVDVDGDQHLDLVLVYTSGLVVAWGNGDGTFAEPSVLLPQLKEGISGVTVLEADGVGPRRELVYMSTLGGSSSAVGVNVTPDRTLERSLSLAGIPPFGPVFGSIIRAADLDRDGIDDLVVSAPDGLHTFLGCGNDQACD